LPDPAKRFKVLPYTRGAEISIEIMDDVTKSGSVMPFLDVLVAAADITLEAVRISEVMAKQMQGGTLPEWERLVAERGRSLKNSFLPRRLARRDYGGLKVP
jgi:hypothetical protein